MLLLRALWNRRVYWVVQVVSNAALLGLGWWWLSLPEAMVWQLAASAVLAIVVSAGVLYTQGLTLAAFRMPAGNPSLMTLLGRLPGLFGWAMATAALMGLAWRFVPGARFAWLPGMVAGLVFVVALPAASEVAGSGWRGLFRASGWEPSGLWQYYAVVLVLAGAGGYLSYKLIWWIPTVEGMPAQAASMAARFGAAYLLAVTAWFGLMAVVSRLSARHGE